MGVGTSSRGEKCFKSTFLPRPVCGVVILLVGNVWDPNVHYRRFWRSCRYINPVYEVWTWAGAQAQPWHCVDSHCPWIQCVSSGWRWQRFGPTVHGLKDQLPHGCPFWKGGLHTTQQRVRSWLGSCRHPLPQGWGPAELSPGVWNSSA